jgi:hypothetical protein
VEVVQRQLGYVSIQLPVDTYGKCPMRKKAVVDALDTSCSSAGRRARDAGLRAPPHATRPGRGSHGGRASLRIMRSSRRRPGRRRMTRGLSASFQKTAAVGFRNWQEGRHRARLPGPCPSPVSPSAASAQSRGAARLHFRACRDTAERIHCRGCRRRRQARPSGCSPSRPRSRRAPPGRTPGGRR